MTASTGDSPCRSRTARRDGRTIIVTLIAVPGGIRAEVIDKGGAVTRFELTEPMNV